MMLSHCQRLENMVVLNPDKDPVIQAFSLLLAGLQRCGHFLESHLAVHIRSLNVSSSRNLFNDQRCEHFFMFRILYHSIINKLTA